MNDEETVVALSRDAKKRIEEISCFGYSLVSNKPLTAREAKSESPDAVISKDEEHYSELVFIRERNIQKYSNVKYIETRYFGIIDDTVPSMKIPDLIVTVCGLSIIGIPLLPFVLFYRGKMRKKAQEAISVNMANDNTRKSLSLQAETILKQN